MFKYIFQKKRDSLHQEEEGIRIFWRQLVSFAKQKPREMKAVNLWAKIVKRGLVSIISKIFFTYQFGKKR